VLYSLLAPVSTVCMPLSTLSLMSLSVARMPPSTACHSPVRASHSSLCAFQSPLRACHCHTTHTSYPVLGAFNFGFAPAGFDDREACRAYLACAAGGAAATLVFCGRDNGALDRKAQKFATDMVCAFVCPAFSSVHFVCATFPLSSHSTPGSKNYSSH